VIGMDGYNNTISKYSIQTSKQPYALKIIQTKNRISKNGGLAHIEVQVIDENGIPVMISDNEITCHITGTGRLLGLEASNNSDMSDYTDNKHRAFYGRILAYVEAKGEEGEIKVKFTSPWLKSTEMIINAE
jgi:hypothetical protein